MTVESDAVRVLTPVHRGLESFLVELGRPARSRTVPVGELEPGTRRVATPARHYGAEVLTTWP
ncbi:hypothetical protein [Geodermatophilus sp. DSM 45219]|uniref:hypothetical protein n=1 Tax=Geodermatophilus sp. DSM 45219 TaxID=1881103 RepID=UPI00115FD0F1|nr:hypothetical protein [Geodermatophilus sp. DSM 45219]